MAQEPGALGCSLSSALASSVASPLWALASSHREAGSGVGAPMSFCGANPHFWGPQGRAHVEEQLPSQRFLTRAAAHRSIYWEPCSQTPRHPGN